jgi:hypothetical protein
MIPRYKEGWRSKFEIRMSKYERILRDSSVSRLSERSAKIFGVFERRGEEAPAPVFACTEPVAQILD